MTVLASIVTEITLKCDSAPREQAMTVGSITPSLAERRGAPTQIYRQEAIEWAFAGLYSRHES